jgi:hypothetical protein
MTVSSGRMSVTGSIAARQRGPTPLILVRDDEHIVFSVGHVLAVVWLKATTAAAVQNLDGVVTRYLATLPVARFCMLHVVERRATLPPAEARSGMASLLQRIAPQLIRSGVAIEGTGFRAAAVRGAATSIIVLTRFGVPQRIFAGVGPALEWLVDGLAEEVGITTRADELAGTVESVRRSRQLG